MAFSTSEKRLTRSQARAGPSVAASKTPNGGSTPSSATQSSCAFSKAGRRVLAELACNDSPIVGLLPAGTPKDKSVGDGGSIRSRRALIADVPSHPACTPLGESLLRSQVQLLLQKVESDLCAHQPEKGLSLHMSANPSVGNVAVASPNMLVAPTPLNTPASVAIPEMPQPGSQCDIVPNALCGASADETMQDAELPPSSAASMASKVPNLHEEMNVKGDAESVGTDCLLESVSTTLGTEIQPSLLLEVSDAPSSTEIFLGKRVLHFGEDTPCKASQDKLSSKVVFTEEAGCSTSAIRQLDDDEASEWSVNVNVGSPAEKLSLVEGTTTGDTSSPSYVKEPSVLHEHVKMMQRLSSSKVHLFWDEDGERIAVEDRRGDIDKLCEEDEDEADDEHDEYGSDNVDNEEYYCEGEDEDAYSGEDCDELCDMLRDMRVEEESKGLPRGEGKHVRFLYENGDDEIVEAMVVRGEEDVFHAGVAVRLKGLPAPLGRHWRFAQGEGDETDEDITS